MSALDPVTPEPSPSAGAAAELVEEAEFGARHFPGWWRWAIVAIGVTWSLFQLAIADFLLLNADQVRAIHLAFGLIMVYLCFPLLKPRGRLGGWAASKPWLRALARHDRPPVLDVVLGLLAVAAALYLVIDAEGMEARQGNPSGLDMVVGIGLIVLLLEAARRALGPALPVVATLFIALSFFSEYLGPVAWRAASATKLVGKVSLSTEGIYGIPLGISASVVFLFVLFGAMLDRAGAGAWFIDLAFSLVGRFRGGAAKAAVLASGLTGVISGSSIANTVTTGTFTITLMRKAGYPAVKAGAVEVAASTNGQLMPPIMGAAAFIIAEYCGLDYMEVVIAAALPAIISYIALVYITHLEACKLGLTGMPRSELPRFWPTLVRGLPYLLPLSMLLIFLMVLRWSPQLSALYAIFILVAVMGLWRAFDGWRAGRIGYELKRTALEMGQALFQGARNMMGIAVAVAAAGIIVGVVTMGLGGKVVELIGFLSGGSLVLVLILTALASLILGMGLPTTANYVVMATLTVPVIVTLGADHGLVVPVLAAHLFCFYFGILADDTPPVGLAAYAAAAISRADPIKTGVQGFTYDMRTAILPFMFIFNHELLLIGVDGFAHGAWVACTALAAMLAFANATQRWLLIKTAWWELILLLVVTMLLLRPGLAEEIELPRWSASLAGLVLYAALIAQQWWRSRRARLA